LAFVKVGAPPVFAGGVDVEAGVLVSMRPDEDDDDVAGEDLTPVTPPTPPSNPAARPPSGERLTGTDCGNGVVSPNVPGTADIPRIRPGLGFSAPFVIFTGVYLSNALTIPRIQQYVNHNVCVEWRKEGRTYAVLTTSVRPTDTVKSFFLPLVGANVVVFCCFSSSTNVKVAVVFDFN
jgi:hypothetical protein